MTVPRRLLLRAAVGLGALLLLTLAAPALAREPLDIRVFAKVGPPGQPEPIAIGPDGRVYVGTNQLGHGDVHAPSKIFAFSAGGELVRDYVVEGQPLDHTTASRAWPSTTTGFSTRSTARPTRASSF